MWILLVEDDRDLADSLQTGLVEEGHTVDVAHDGLDAEVRARTNAYDLLVVDWMLPGLDGRTLVERLRRHGVRCPVLMLTAMAEVDYRIRGLDAGADDYLTKPFAFEELFARLRALQRRGLGAEETGLQVQAGPLCVDLRQRRVEVGGTPVVLRAKEFGVLEVLVQRRGAVVTRTVLAERVWGSLLGVSDDVINMTVSSLRQKLQEVSSEVEIKTLRGMGYTLSASTAASEAAAA